MAEDFNWLQFFADRERRFAEFYVRYAHQHAKRDPEAYAGLEAEIGNLFKSAAWFADHNEAGGVLALASALWQESDFLRSRGYMQRGLPLLEQARELARVWGDTDAEFRLLEAVAHAHLLNGNPFLSQPLYEQALSIAEGSDQPLMKAHAQLGLGRLFTDLGEFDRAVVYLKGALQNCHGCSDYGLEIEVLTCLGNVLCLQGHFAEATNYLEASLPTIQARQDQRGKAEIYFALGYAAALARDWPQAISYFEVATEVAQQTGDRFREVRGLHNMGEAWLELGDVSKALELLEKAVIQQEAIDDVVTKAFTHFYLAKAYKLRHDLEACLGQLGHVFPFQQVPVSITLAVEAEWLKAEVYLEQGNFDLTQSSLINILQLVPEHMHEMRHQAQSLLKALQDKEEEVASCVIDQSRRETCERR